MCKLCCVVGSDRSCRRCRVLLVCLFPISEIINDNSVVCQTCKNYYHLLCLDLVESDINVDDWRCDWCLERCGMNPNESDSDSAEMVNSINPPNPTNPTVRRKRNLSRMVQTDTTHETHHSSSVDFTSVLPPVVPDSPDSSSRPRLILPPF